LFIDLLPSRVNDLLKLLVQALSHRPIVNVSTDTIDYWTIGFSHNRFPYDVHIITTSVLRSNSRHHSDQTQLHHALAKLHEVAIFQ